MSIEPFIIILAAISLGSFAKGLTGIGLPLIGVPVLAGFFGVQHAAAVMAIPVLASNAWIVWSYRHLAGSIPGLALSLGASMIGTVLGAYVLASLDDRMLIYLLATWIGLYLINMLFNREFRLQGRAARILSPVIATFAGISQGATGISGPVVATWIHSYRLAKEAYVFGVSVIFLVMAATHLVAVSGFGLMDQERLVQGLIAVVPVLIFVPIGMRMTRAISQTLFNRLIITLVIVMEFKLIWQATTG